MENSAFIEQLLTSAVIHPRVAPAAAAGFVVQMPKRGAYRRRAGVAGALPGNVTAKADTLFDLASVSKPVVACAAARLVARGALSLGAPLGSLLVEARGTPSEDLPLELFLSHRAGLVPHLPLFAPLFRGNLVSTTRALTMAARARRSECVGMPGADGFAPVYSDMGFALVGAALTSVTRKPLDDVIRDEVAAPLGLELGSARKLRAARASFSQDVAPTETQRARGGTVRGIVHDENAWALSGHGTSGHAGLFSTVEGVLGFGAALLEVMAGTSVWLERAAFEPLIRVRPGGTLRAGFDGKAESGSSAGQLSSAETFGHLGFTGTSLWCDPVAGIATVFLSNRVCPTRDNPRIRAARPQVHDALFRDAGASRE